MSDFEKCLHPKKIKFWFFSLRKKATYFAFFVLFKKYDFELNLSQRVRFWTEVFTTRQILDWKKYNALDFELKIFRHVRFSKTFASKKTTFWFFSLRENDIFCIFRVF